MQTFSNKLLFLPIFLLFISCNNAIKGENDEIEYQRFLSEPTISNYLIKIYNSRRDTNIQIFGLKENIDHILEIIRSELKQKK